jgi:hypothetical protein
VSRPKRNAGKRAAARALTVEAAPGDEDAAIARSSLAPETQAAITLRCFQPVGLEQDINAAVSELRKQADAASSNNLARVEAMLAVQAHTLDAIFNDMARRAALNRAKFLDAADKYLRLALKAQSQCRATIEALAEIKNPRPVAFVQQANIAAGATSPRF